MTLFRQIIIILSFFQTIILGIVMWQNFNTVSEFVQTQLEVDARHTAHSLGLSITPAAANNDMITIEAMMSSMFDSGYYESIILKDVDGKVLAKNYQKVSIADVPEWFVSLFDLKAPEVSSEVMAGWSKFGSLHVRDSIGIAYRQLWLTFKDISLAFIIITLIAFFILYISLKLILKPLKFVQDQAEAITGNDFIFQENLPNTVELKHVVGAMNSMVGKVKEIFEKEAQAVKKYHNLLYKDENTDLFNRRYFMLKLGEYLEDEEHEGGFVSFINFANYSKLKAEIGYEKSKSLLDELKALFAKEFCDGFVVSRLDVEDYAVLAPQISRELVETKFKHFGTNTQELIKKYELDLSKYYFNFGICPFGENEKSSDILSRADFALTTAKSMGHFALYIYDNTKETVLGKEAWKKEILDAIEEKRFIFAMQKAVSKDDYLFHNEIFLRLEDRKGEIKNAAYFMPMVGELNLNGEVDVYVLERIASSLEYETYLSSPLAINIGKEILLDASKLVWFDKLLGALKAKLTNPIYFEVSTRADIDAGVLSNFSKLLRKRGFGLGLDNFSLDGESLKLLQDIVPAYVKTSASSLLDLLGDKHAESSKQSLDIITTSMDIKVVAMGVSSKEQREKLYKLGIDFVQGNFIEKPYICMN